MLRSAGGKFFDHVLCVLACVVLFGFGSFCLFVFCFFELSLVDFC